MKGVHGPGPKRGSMDQGSMFCPLPEPTMKLGVNTDVNSKSVPVGIKHNLGKSKVLLPHTSVIKKRSDVKKSEEVKNETPLTKPSPAKPETTKHEINLAVMTIVVGGLAWFMFR